MPTSSPAQALLDQALPLHRAGQLRPARALYRQALTLEPALAEAEHLLGVTFLQTGEPAAALPRLQRAVALAPGHAKARNNLGAALRGLGRTEEAAQAFAQAAAADPGFTDALHNQAAALLQLGRGAEALAPLRRLLALAPDDPTAQGQYALALLDAGQPEQALAALERAPQDSPLLLQARLDALRALHRHAEALAAAEALLALLPESAAAWDAKGVALLALGRAGEALAAHDRALALAPGDAAMLTNRAVALERLDRLPEALASLDAALAKAPGDPLALFNRGVVREEMQDPAGAAADWLACRNADPDAAFSLGLLHLRQGDFAAGWAGYEARRQGSHADARLRQPAPLWRGETPLAGRTILLHDEQGAGDSIQFCRYAPLLAAQGARVLLQVPSPLAGLFRSLPGIQVVPLGQPVPRHDVQCSLLSLPYALGTRLDSIPAATPYLHAEPARVAAWRARLGEGFKVALVASGNPAHRRDARRSIALAALARALRRPGRRLVLAQRDIRPEEAAYLAAEGRDILSPGRALTDFAETAGLLAACDAVVSVDTAPAHLAGALGLPLWVLLPAVADFRWLEGRADSPWYPTARLLRQPRPGAWAPVLAELEQQALQIC